MDKEKAMDWIRNAVDKMIVGSPDDWAKGVLELYDLLNYVEVWKEDE